MAWHTKSVILKWREKKKKKQNPPTLINTVSSANYSNIHRCYSIHMHWVSAAWKQMFWRDGSMTRTVRHGHFSCFRSLHLSSTSAFNADANSPYRAFGEKYRKKEPQNICFHICTLMTTVCSAALNAAVGACGHLVWSFDRNKGRKGTSECGCPFDFLAVLS